MPHWCPPNAESPFASLRCYLAEGNICCYLNRHCPVLIAHAGSWARPKSSLRLRLSLLRLVFAGCCQPLLDDVPSRRYLCNPYMSAWTLTPHPAVFPRCTYPFLPEEHQPHVRSETFGTLNCLCNATSTEHAFSGLRFDKLTALSLSKGSHFVMFRLSCLLDLQVAPTVETQRPQGGQAVYTTQWIGGYPT